MTRLLIYSISKFKRESKPVLSLMNKKSIRMDAFFYGEKYCQGIVLLSFKSTMPLIRR